MTRDGSVPSNFLMPKIRKLAKNLVYFSLYRRGRSLLWELRQTFLLSNGIKILASNFGVLPYLTFGVGAEHSSAEASVWAQCAIILGSCSPKISERKNLVILLCGGFQLCDFIANISGLEQDIVDRKMALQTAITPSAVHAYQIW